MTQFTFSPFLFPVGAVSAYPQPNTRTRTVNVYGDAKTTGGGGRLSVGPMGLARTLDLGTWTLDLGLDRHLRFWHMGT
jgi:hypothetical protein